MNVTLRRMRGRGAGYVKHLGRVVLGASGAISSTDCDGFTVTKTASKTGRYTIQLVDSRGNAITALKLRSAFAEVIGPDDAGLTTGKGVQTVVRADTVATNGQFFLQFITSNAGNADTEVQDNASFDIEFWVKDSSVT